MIEIEQSLAIPDAAIAAAESLIEQRKQSRGWKQIDQIERKMAEGPQPVCPLDHLFTPVPGHPELQLYRRKILMPAGALLTSYIHLFEHPFVISRGIVSVWSDDSGWETFRAPYHGTTKPATRRLLYIHEDTEWATYHVTTQNDPDRVVDEIARSPFEFGHMEGLEPEKRIAIENNHRATPLLP